MDLHSGGSGWRGWVGFGLVGLWGPIKTNQGSGVTFGTCLLLRSLALYPESSICICHLQYYICPMLASAFGVTIKADLF